MSAAETQQTSGTGSTEGPQPAEPSMEQLGQQMVGQADSISEPLEGEYDTQLEVIGDVHDTDIEGYKNYLTSKYGEEGPDAIAFTGDAADNHGIRANGPELDPQEFTGEAKSTYGILDEIGEEFDVPVYKVRGNHEAVKGAHPGNEAVVEEIEEYAEENEEGFEDYEGNYDDFLVEQFDRLEDISYDSVELEGGMTLVGGGAHYDPEEGVDPEKGLEGFLEEYDEDDWEEEEWDDLIGGSWFGLGDIINAAYDSYRSFRGHEKEEYLPDEVKTEAHKEYEDKYEKLDELLSEAGENTVVLTHGAPYGEDGDSIDYMGEERGNQGSVLWKEMLQKHDVDTYFFGHQHGGGEDEMYGTNLVNVGKGQYFEAGLVDGEVEDQRRIEQGELQNWKTVNQIRDDGPEPLYDEIGDGFERLEQDVERIGQQVEQNSVPGEQVDALEGKLEQRKEMLGARKKRVDAISTTLGHETEEIEKDVDVDLGVETDTDSGSQGPAQPQQPPQPGQVDFEEAKEQLKEEAMADGLSEEEAERMADLQIQRMQQRQTQQATA